MSDLNQPTRYFRGLQQGAFMRLEHAASLKGLLKPFKGKGDLEQTTGAGTTFLRWRRNDRSAMGVALWQELMASTSTPVNLLADLHAIELQRITLNMQISLLHTLGRQAQECASKAAEAEDAYLRRLASIPPGVRDR
jgi:hypothetical protein